MMNVFARTRDLLFKIGLSEAEVLIYVELLRAPVRVKYDLVRRTRLSKSVVYRALSSLKKMKMISMKDGLIKAISLKFLISNLRNSSRKFGKMANQLQRISPFLSFPKESIEEIDFFCGDENVSEQYLEMSQRDYDVNLDFGDFESIVDHVGGIDTTFTFRKHRVKHAKHFALCTTFGENTAHFSTKEAEKEFNNKICLLNCDFRNKFIIFSDKNDYVLFINSEEEVINATRVKSKFVADMQRAQFDLFSRLMGKN